MHAPVVFGPLAYTQSRTTDMCASSPCSSSSWCRSLFFVNARARRTRAESKQKKRKKGRRRQKVSSLAPWHDACHKAWLWKCASALLSPAHWTVDGSGWPHPSHARTTAKAIYPSICINNLAGFLFPSHRDVRACEFRVTDENRKPALARLHKTIASTSSNSILAPTAV